MRIDFYADTLGNFPDCEKNGTENAALAEAI